MNRQLILILALSLTFNSYSQNALERIKEKRVLNIGILETGIEPLNSYEEIRGRDLALLLEVDYKFTTYKSINSLKRALSSNDIDIALFNRYKTLSDSLNTSISHPIAEVKMVLLTNRLNYSGKRLDPGVLEQLEGNKLEINTLNQESFINTFNRENSGIDLINSYPHEILIEKLIKGEILSVYIDEFRAKEIFKDNPELGIDLIYTPLLESQEIVALLSWKESFFLDWINIAIEGWGEPADMKRIIEVTEGEYNE